MNSTTNQIGISMRCSRVAVGMRTSVPDRALDQLIVDNKHVTTQSTEHGDQLISTFTLTLYTVSPHLVLPYTTKA